MRSGFKSNLFNCAIQKNRSRFGGQSLKGLTEELKQSAFKTKQHHEEKKKIHAHQKKKKSTAIVVDWSTFYNFNVVRRFFFLFCWLFMSSKVFKAIVLVISSFVLITNCWRVETRIFIKEKGFKDAGACNWIGWGDVIVRCLIMGC